MAEIRTHRKAEHPNYRPCKNYPGTSAEDRCKFGDRCDWPHLHLSPDSHICWTCGNIFTSQSDLSIHRKKVHKSTGPCKYYGQPGGCKRGDEGCHYLHIQTQSHPNEAHASTPQHVQTQSRPEEAHASAAPQQYQTQSTPSRSHVAAQETPTQPQLNEAHKGTPQGFQGAHLNPVPPGPTSTPSGANPLKEFIKEFMTLQQQLNQQFLARLEQ